MTVERTAVELVLGQRLLERLFQGVGQDPDPLHDPLGHRLEIGDLARPHDECGVEGVLTRHVRPGRPIAPRCPSVAGA